jgi:hypothetical protein
MFSPQLGSYLGMSARLKFPRVIRKRPFHGWMTMPVLAGAECGLFLHSHDRQVVHDDGEREPDDRARRDPLAAVQERNAQPNHGDDKREDYADDRHAASQKLELIFLVRPRTLACVDCLGPPMSFAVTQERE